MTEYSLNDSIRNTAQESHNKLKAYIAERLPQADKEAMLIIIDGSLQRLCETKEYAEKVIDGLVKLLW